MHAGQDLAPVVPAPVIVAAPGVKTVPPEIFARVDALASRARPEDAPRGRPACSRDVPGRASRRTRPRR